MMIISTASDPSGHLQQLPFDTKGNMWAQAPIISQGILPAGTALRSRQSPVQRSSSSGIPTLTITKNTFPTHHSIISQC
ncbi:hypothetical protein CDV36_016394 [Fusarium kuroshium]|uniref:Uncharacterized protein n=1 Tax=Fusarium kuroshium TaxID=2010991 RepID=A0A3M2QRQ4_9HYPO|nr:hypothetical protein CDV36_016394 [Fusarium kuroshium]